MMAINLENVTKAYGSQRALDSLTLGLFEGQVTGILGPNGAGKSTLFKAIVGLVRPDAGRITVLDSRPSWKTNGQIAYLSDQCRWYGSHTVQHSIDYAAAVFPHFDQKRAEQLLASMGLNRDVTVGTLSKGHEARLKLIICLARDVRLMLLDEPFSGIDLVSREKIIQGLIESFAERKQTIIISTHEIREAESLFDQVVFIDQGQVVLSGEVEALRQEKGSLESIYRGLFQ
ncbi:MAG: ABC transporter ATP-binding protein [Thermacetogeniaceae bacterium]